MQTANNTQAQQQAVVTSKVDSGSSSRVSGPVVLTLEQLQLVGGGKGVALATTSVAAPKNGW